VGMKAPRGLCKECLRPTGRDGRPDKDRLRCPEHEHEKGHKYRACVVLDEQGRVLYRSRKEMHRHQDLLRLEMLGVVTGLRREVPYALVVNGKKVATYRADFVYRVDGRKIVEDAKGVRTEAYRLKARLWEAVVGTKIREV
jgi:hypothetical protein